MEPVTTTAMIGAVVGYLAKKLKDNKSINDFFNDFTEATVNWIKPIFIKDERPKEVLENLQNNPSDDLNQKDATTAIERLLRQNPDSQKLLLEMYEIINKKRTSGETISINNSKNVNTGNVNTGGGRFNIGDNIMPNK